MNKNEYFLFQVFGQIKKVEEIK